MTQLLRLFWTKYQEFLIKYPKSTKCLTGGLISGFGDVFIQLLFEQGKSYNYTRTLTMSTYGILQTKLEVIYWYKLLDSLFGKQQSIKNSFFKTLADLAFFSPLEIGLCVSWVSYFDSQEKSIKEKLEEEFGTILMANYAYWFPFGFCCFYLVPVQCRALYIGMVSLGWDMYISFASHNTVNKECFEGLLNKIEFS